MGARVILVIALIVLLLGVTSSGTGVIKRAPAFVRNVIDALVIVAAVRIGLSVAILAFDSTVANYAIPIATGLLAAGILLWMRRRERRPS
jgi:glucose uptake protein GlcU